MDKSGQSRKIKNESEVAEFWNEYLKTRAIYLRNALMEHYLHMVVGISGAVYKQIINARVFVDINDLQQAGTFGLKRAVEHFNPSQGTKFQSYAMPHVRGAMLDYLRKLDWTPRSVRSRMRTVDEFINKQKARSGISPSRTEIGEHFDLDDKILDETIDLLSRPPNYSSSFCESDDESGIPDFELMEDHLAVMPDLTVHLKELIRRLLVSLDRRERLVIMLYYYEQMTMKQIGEVVGISESRISQIHAEVLRRLKETPAIALIYLKGDY